MRWLMELLPGIFAVGAVYESAGMIEGDPISSVYEYFVQVEQLIYRESLSRRRCDSGAGYFRRLLPTLSRLSDHSRVDR